MKFFILVFISILLFQGVHGSRFPRRTTPKRAIYGTIESSPIVQSFMNDKKHGRGLHIDIDTGEFLKKRVKRI